MKRFTDTQKWSDQWYRTLSPKLKCFWEYMLSECDSAGVWKPDFALAAFCIGEPVTEDEARATYASRVQVLASGRWFVTGFIKFQYGELNPDCRPHAAVSRLLEHHGIGYAKGIFTLKDKDRTGKGQGQEKDDPGDSKGGHVPAMLKQEVGKHFNRKPNAPWPYDEETALCEVARRPDALAEWLEILVYRNATQKDGYARQSVKSLVENWASELDKARIYANRGNTYQRSNGPIITPDHSKGF